MLPALIFATSILLDTVTTLTCISAGLREANPVAARMISAHPLLWVTLNLLLILVVAAVAASAPRVVAWGSVGCALLLSAAAVRFAAAANNVAKLLRFTAATRVG